MKLKKNHLIKISFAVYQCLDHEKLWQKLGGQLYFEFIVRLLEIAKKSDTLKNDVHFDRLFSNFKNFRPKSESEEWEEYYKEWTKI